MKFNVTENYPTINSKQIWEGKILQKRGWTLSNSGKRLHSCLALLEKKL